ncbi:MAG: helix-turn-helix domain-containing protein, partial [Treponema sp.]|nr:helix-turn-helix domain-containing protein [Treponema sp.]
RAALDSRGLTVKELSALTGIAKGTLDCYLGTRASMPPADVAAKIAGSLGITVEYLVSGHERKRQENAIGAIAQILPHLGERDVETILALSKVLKAQMEKK